MSRRAVFFTGAFMTILKRTFADRPAIVAIVAVASAAFCLSLANGFVWDDLYLVVPNEAYKQFDLAAILQGRAHSLEYLPVRDLSLALDMQAWGARPFGFHLTNLLLYLAGLVALFVTVRELSLLFGIEGPPGQLAFWTTVIFALHPLHTEVVNFITGRNTLLAALFLFLSMTAIFRGLREQRPVLIVVSLFSYLLAVFSKAIVIFFPAFLLVLFIVRPDLPASQRTKALALAGFLVIAAAAAWIHAARAVDAGIMDYEMTRFGVNSSWLPLAKAVQVPFYYLRMALIPYPLNVEYAVTFTSGHWLARSLLAGSVILVALAGAWILRQRAPMVTLGLAWYLMSLGPVLNLFPTHPVVADRYAYLAVAGIGLIGAHVLTLAIAKGKMVLLPVLFVLLFWAGIDMSRSLDWRTDITLWSAAIAANPGAERINLADALWREGRTEEALGHLREEQRRNRTHYASLYEGKLHMQKGRVDEAIVSFERSLNEGGDAFRDVHLALAQAYEKGGDGAKALDHYLRSLEARSVDASGQYEREARDGAERVRSQYAARTIALRERANRLPADAGAQAEAALFLYTIGLYQEAEHFYRNALKIEPARWDVWYNLGLTYKRNKQYAEAVLAFEKAADLNPRNVHIMNNLGICLEHARDYRNAEKSYRRALELDPRFLYAGFNLGRLYFMTGDASRARSAFENARALAAGDPALQNRIDHYLGQLQ